MLDLYLKLILKFLSIYTTKWSGDSGASRRVFTLICRQTWPIASAVGTTTAAIQDLTMVRREAKYIFAHRKHGVVHQIC